MSNTPNAVTYDFSGQTALVTGGGGNLGQAVAGLFTSPAPGWWWLTGGLTCKASFLPGRVMNGCGWLAELIFSTLRPSKTW